MVAESACVITVLGTRDAARSVRSSGTLRGSTMEQLATIGLIIALWVLILWLVYDCD